MNPVHHKVLHEVCFGSPYTIVFKYFLHVQVSESFHKKYSNTFDRLAFDIATS